jgi:dUTP pyrophosphatase
MDLKVKKITDLASYPRKSHWGDACFDLYATGFKDGCFVGSWIFDTGIAIEIPDGYYGQILTRSSCAKIGLVVLGGVIDSGYRGEIKIIVHALNINDFAKCEEMEEILKGYVNTSYIDKTTHETTYLEGHSIAQLVILPVQDITIVACEELSETERGTNGFGSTNKNKLDM